MEEDNHYMDPDVRYYVIGCKTHGCPEIYESHRKQTQADTQNSAKNAGWKSGNNHDFTCLKCSNILGGSKGACLVIQTARQNGLGNDCKIPNYGVIDGNPFKIILGEKNVTLGRIGHPVEQSKREPEYIEVVPTCDGAPFNVSLNHARIEFSGSDYVFTTLKQHEGAVEIIRGSSTPHRSATFKNPVNFVLRNEDTIKMGTVEKKCYLTLGFFESK
jgi:hypothetical protein